MVVCYSQKHILSSSSLFLFFNESSSTLFPYFSSSAHRLLYFFKPLVFLLISSNPNATRLCQPCSPPSFVFYMVIYYSQKHILLSSSLFLFFNELSSSLFLYFFKLLVFLLISSNPNVAYLCQPCSPPSSIFYLAICYSQKHILSSSSLFLFFNESPFSLFPYFSSLAHRLPYFFNPLVFLLISSNLNATRLCQPCLPPSFVFYMAICYSQKHIFLSSSLFHFFNESSSSLFPYFSLSAHRLPYFFKPLVFLLISSNPNATRLCQPCSPTSFVFYMAICYSQKHILSSSSLFVTPPAR
jgi:hypothetical protein